MKTRKSLRDRKPSPNKSGYVSWDDGEEKLIRFASDEIVSTLMHTFVQTTKGQRSFVCQRDEDLEAPAEDCRLCSTEGGPRERTFGLVAVRKSGELGEIQTLEQGPKFWDSFTAFQEKYGTLMDRDYSVKRIGARLDTTYMIIPEDKSEQDFEAEVVELAKKQLVERIENQASKKYYALLDGEGDE